MFKIEKKIEECRIGKYGNNFIDEHEILYVNEVLKSKKLFRYDDHDNSMTFRLEKTLAEYFNTKHALALCNGTAALKSALIACNIRQGDEILVTPYTFVATINAIISIGAIPVFVDIDETLSLSIKNAEKKITDKTRCAIQVHLQGDAADSISLATFCDKYGIKMIEDAAQAFGTKLGERFVGSFGNVGCFSLQSNKLIACGEGGFIITKDHDTFIRARNFHDYGAFRNGGDFGDWDNPLAFMGENLKISELQSAVALGQIEKAPEIIKQLQNRKDAFVSALELNSTGFKLRPCCLSAKNSGVATGFIAPSFNLRAQIVDRLNKRGVFATSLYSTLVYELLAFKKEESKKYWKSLSADCEVAKDLSSKLFWVIHSLDYDIQDHEIAARILSEECSKC
jgi:8-amino-3,8-dideoxy-alpha-D-manno-octulosonate transaminase